jgi:hypothetical protein
MCNNRPKIGEGFMRIRCDNCGNEFVPRQWNGRFCSPLCSINFHQAERRRGVAMLRQADEAQAKEKETKPNDRQSYHI